jgi:ABC-type glycerol-3-phosphate transport system permease component
MRRVPVYAAAVAVGAFSAFPILWVLITSLKQRGEIFTETPDLWPNNPDFGRYADVLLDSGVGRALVNSLLVAGVSTVLGVVIAAFAGYAVARFAFPFRRAFMVAILTTQMFPLVVLIIPLFIVMRRAELLGTYVGLIIVYLAFTVPLAVWILRGFIETIPVELEEAALVDGATRFGAMRRIVLPLALPGLATCATFSFINAWNEFMFALTFMTRERGKTVTAGIASVSGASLYDVPWGPLSAAVVLATLPLVGLVLVFEKRITSGLTGGAVKG